MEENIYQKYDKIIAITISNILSFSKDNKILLGSFNEKDINHLFFFEIAKIVKTCWNFNIYVEMPLLKYIKFYFKNRKLKIKRLKKENSKNKININTVLDFEKTQINEQDDIFEKIYNIYYKKEE